MKVRKYGVSNLSDQRDPRWKAIRRTLHENKIGCLTEWADHAPRRCHPVSIVHNQAATAILDALDALA